MFLCFLAVAYFKCNFFNFFFFFSFVINVILLIYLGLPKCINNIFDLYFFLIFKYLCVFLNFISLLSVDSFRFILLNWMLIYLILSLIWLLLVLKILFWSDSSWLMSFRESFNFFLNHRHQISLWHIYVVILI